MCVRADIQLKCRRCAVRLIKDSLGAEYNESNRRHKYEFCLSLYIMFTWVGVGHSLSFYAELKSPFPYVKAMNCHLWHKQDSDLNTGCLSKSDIGNIVILTSSSFSSSSSPSSATSVASVEASLLAASSAAMNPCSAPVAFWPGIGGKPVQ